MSESMRRDLFRASVLGVLFIIAATLSIVVIRYHLEASTAAALANGVIKVAPTFPGEPDFEWAWALVAAMAAPALGAQGGGPLLSLLRARAGASRAGAAGVALDDEPKDPGEEKAPA